MNRQTKSEGFTLIEVLVTLIILSVSLLALAALMAKTTRSNSFGGHITEAATLAQDKLEELRAVQWSTIAEGETSDQKNGCTGINFIRDIHVQQSGNIKTITITVKWFDPSGHSIRLISAMSQ